MKHLPYSLGVVIALLLVAGRASAADIQGEVEGTSAQGIELTDGRLIGIDAATRYERATPTGPAKAKASDVKQGVKVRAELDPKSKVATKVTIEEKKGK